MSDDRTCRLCLSTEGAMEEIFASPEAELSKKIFECTSVEVKNLVGLPALICEICKSELIIWMKFRRQCLKSNEILKAKFPALFAELQIEQSEAGGSKRHEFEEMSEGDEESRQDDPDYQDEPEDDEDVPLLRFKVERTNDFESEELQQTEDESLGVSERTITMQIEPQDGNERNTGKRRMTRNFTEEMPRMKRKSSGRGETVKFIYPDNRVCYVTKCTVCGKEQQNIKQHMRIHLDLKPFQCPYCERAFRQRGNYTRHVNIHTGEKPYKCDQCEKAFADPASLRAHIVKHTGSRAYRCEVCGKSYGHSHVLAAHKRIHTQDRRHPCSYCVKRFLSSHALKKHIRTHTGERPYQCKLCPKSFTTSGNLATHNRVHTKVKPYACTVCDMSFAYRSVLKTHLKTHDRSGPDEEEPTTIVIETKDDDTNEENGNDELRSEIGDEIEYEIYLNVFDDPEGKDSEAGEET